MPWVVGIDEAGYGPNLGPLVMTAVAFRVPPGLVGADWWEALRPGVRRFGSEDDGRLLVDDSKLVYKPARGLRNLEKSVLAALACSGVDPGPCVQDFLGRLRAEAAAELGGERWYTGQSRLPTAAEPAEVAPPAEQFHGACREAGVALCLVRTEVIGAARFNRLLDEHDSKAAALADALVRLVGGVGQAADGREPLSFFVDKHSGRNAYAALLQQALPDGLVVAREEGMARSAYGVLGLDREVHFTFQPRADGEHFCVALASLVSKYVRELLMAEFNRFWQGQVPGLEPTAGYPGDAARFFRQIRCALERLGVPEEVVWRRR